MSSFADSSWYARSFFTQPIPDTTNTIATQINFIRSLAGFNYTMDVADGAAAVDLQVSGIIRDGTGFTQAMTLQKTGAGTLALTGANTYVDPTTIAAGTLQIGAGGTTGTPGTGAITNNATLAFNRSDALAVANVISGTGALTHAGTGTTTLTGAVSYSGATNVNAGTLITTPAQTGATSITVADGASFRGNSVPPGTTFSETPSPRDLPQARASSSILARSGIHPRRP